MLETLKQLINKYLSYKPIPETAEIRGVIRQQRIENLPYCSDDEGDLIFSLIQKHQFKACLETGFHTGSTALYLAKAVSHTDGEVTSVCLDDEEKLQRGRKLLAVKGHDKVHRLTVENSNTALPELFSSGERFDFVFIDGWKTFDHLAVEVYFLNQMLNRGGVLFFDDAYMPAVRKINLMLVRHYEYEEVEYSRYIKEYPLRLHQMVTRRSRHRPYRAFRKLTDTDNQPPFRDWHFYRPF